MSAMEAANALKSMGQMARKLITAADELEKIGSLEQAEQEAKARLKAAQEDADTAQKRLSDLKDQCSKAQTEAVKTAAAASADADSIRARATQEAEGQLEKAKTLADGILAKAKAEAQKASDDGVARVVELDKTAREKRAELAQLNNEIAQKAGEAKAIELKLEVARAKMQELLAR